MSRFGVVCVILWIGLASTRVSAQSASSFYDGFEGYTLGSAYSSFGIFGGGGGLQLNYDSFPPFFYAEFDPSQRIIPGTNFQLRVDFRDRSFVGPPGPFGSTVFSVQLISVATGSPACSLSYIIASDGTHFYRRSAPGTPTASLQITPTSAGRLMIRRLGNNYEFFSFSPAFGFVPLGASASGIAEPVYPRLSVGDFEARVVLDDLVILLPSNECSDTNLWEATLGRPFPLDVSFGQSTSSSSDPLPTCDPEQNGFSGGRSNWVLVRPRTASLRIRTTSGIGPYFPDAQNTPPVVAALYAAASPCASLTELGCGAGCGPIAGCADVRDVRFEVNGLTPGLPYLLFLDQEGSVPHHQLLVTVSSPILYVDANAPPGGDGQTWSTAFRELSEALTVANSVISPSDPRPLVDEIRVAQGLYLPGRLSPSAALGGREATFVVPELTLRGGYRGAYDGSGLSPDDRNFDVFETILSGDLDGNDVYTPGQAPAFTDSNAFSVVTIVSSAVLDGLTIEGGNANQAFNMGSHYRGGGVASHSGPPSDDERVLIDCCLRFNQATLGGGISAEGGHLQLIRTTLEDNYALDPAPGSGLLSGQGGGLLCFSMAASPLPGREAAVTLTDCSLLRNEAKSGGGALLSLADSVVVSGSQFEGNRVRLGGNGVPPGVSAVLVLSDLQVGTHVRDCSFTGNVGGAALQISSIGAVAGGATISDCSFVGQTGNSLSLLLSTSSFNLVERCSFLFGSPTPNVPLVTTLASPAWVTGDGTALFSECLFQSNSGIQSGGLWVTSSQFAPLTLRLDRCRFLENASSGPGSAGGVTVTSGIVEISNSLLANNQAVGPGAGVAVQDPGVALVVRGSTIADNTAGPGLTGGLHMATSGTLEISNTIIWGNSGADLAVQGSTLLTGGYSLWSGSSAAPLPGLVDADPDFVAPASGDYRLAPGSIAIDAGNNSVLGTTFVLDLDGNPRAIDDPATPDTGFGAAPLTDMGAYESLGSAGLRILRGDLNDDLLVNVADPVTLLTYLFSGGTLDCLLPADVNGDDGVDIADGISLLTYLFSAGPPPVAPFPNCGAAISPTLSCAVPPTACGP
ncbi:MAG: hypothetical protein AB7O52_19475 [Planctomycetota bacterium]